MSIFTKIFQKKEPLVPFNLSFLGTDIHSHLIPFIDDGAKSVEISLLLAQGLLDLGYKKAVTTPHVMSDYYRNTPETINTGLAAIQNEYAANQIGLGISAAAEYYIDYDFISKVGKEKLLTFGDNYILVEFSFVEPPRIIKEAFFELQTNGYKPVLAHPERYAYWHENPKILFELKDREVLFQLNINSLTGFYGEGPAKMGEWLIEKSMVEWLGTDMHNQHHLELLKTLMLKESLSQKLRERSFLNQTL